MKWTRRILNRIFALEKWLLEEKEPNEWKKVDWTDVLDALIKEFPLADTNIWVRDRYYYLCSVDDVKEFLTLDPTDKEKYVTEVFDCDDFSFRLMGQFEVMPWSSIGMGIAWSRVHAYNVGVTKEGVFLIEPQTDAVFAPRGDEKYETEFIII